jgi:hypothetical protein
MVTCGRGITHGVGGEKAKNAKRSQTGANVVANSPIAYLRKTDLMKTHNFLGSLLHFDAFFFGGSAESAPSSEARLRLVSAFRRERTMRTG